MKYDGTHKIQIINCGEDTVEITADLTSDELDTILKVVNKLSEENQRMRTDNQYWYAPTLLIHDIDAVKINRDETEVKNHRKYVASAVGVNTISDALKSAGVL